MKLIQYIRNLRVENLLRPEVSLPVVYLAFLVFAFISFKLPNTRELLLQPRGYFSQEPLFLTYGLSVLAIVVLSFSAKIGRRLVIRCRALILILSFATGVVALYLTYPVHPILILAVAGGYASILWFISRRLEEINLITSIGILLAIFSSLAILIKGIPIMDVVSRESVAVTPARALFHGFAVFSATLLITFYERRKSFPAISMLVVLAAASGFKSDAVAIIVSAGIAGMLAERLKIREILLGLGGVVFILTVMSTHIAQISYGVWRIVPALYIFYRAGFTFSVFDKIVQISFPYGYAHGGALLSTTQEIASTKVLGYQEPHIITSTLIGPGMLDFGILGLGLTSALLGLYLGIMYGLKNSKIQICLYAIALTHTFILIEVGLQLTSIIFYLSLLYLAIAGVGDA